MKIRTGFVSNSSSSSFILTKDEVGEFEKVVNHQKIYKVSDLLKKFEVLHMECEKLKKMYNELSEDDNTVPYFMQEDFYYYDFSVPYYDELKVLFEEDPEAYITGSIDDYNLKFYNGCLNKRFNRL